VMLVCNSCKRPVRVVHEKHGDKHVRICRHCKTTLEK